MHSPKLPFGAPATVRVTTLEREKVAASLAQAAIDREIGEQILAFLEAEDDNRNIGKWVFRMVNAMELHDIMEMIYRPGRQGARNKAATARVLTFSMKRTAWNCGRIRATREEIAGALRLDPGTVSVAMADLERFGAVERRPGGKGTAQVTYWFSPAVAWLGEMKRRRAAVVAARAERERQPVAA